MKNKTGNFICYLLLLLLKLFFTIKKRVVGLCTPKRTHRARLVNYNDLIITILYGIKTKTNYPVKQKVIDRVSM